MRYVTKSGGVDQSGECHLTTAVSAPSLTVVSLAMIRYVICLRIGVEQDNLRGKPSWPGHRERLFPQPETNDYKNNIGVRA